ncbi:calcium:proton antiporter [Acidisoma cladoniae]|jgi:Ca2+:H+ antiporter|uniref:calcium:proton antiporter n=1 Tax=Acidisoma cladoniae TaxID=3040935 RepID=UPI00254CFDAA|nr:calcium:proton antiporter [Acidisoma sp. PAMC 29798]
MTDNGLPTFLRREWPLAASLATCAIFAVSGHSLMADLGNPLWLAFIFLWLFAVILGSAISVVRHADQLAIRLGEPYGTLILTLSVTFIEVMSISAVMLHGANNPTLTRDTLFAVVMILLNGMVGLSLLAGAWRHREQHYNLQGANTYLGAIIPLIVLSMIMPDFTQTTAGPVLSLHQSLFLALVAIGLYCTFLAMQTGRHRNYFMLLDEVEAHEAQDTPKPPIPRHAILLVAYMAPVVFLAEQLAHPIDYLIETLHAPAPLGGVVMAVLVAAPEAIGAVRAALANHLQRSFNIFLGSVLSTIGLTIPAMILISELTGRHLILGVEHTDEVMLLLTLAVSIVTFASGRTNVIQGAVHLILFASYIALIFEN